MINKNYPKLNVDIIILTVFIIIAIIPFIFIELLRSTLYLFLPLFLILLIYLSENRKHKIIMVVIGTPLFIIWLITIGLMLWLYIAFKSDGYL